MVLFATLVGLGSWQIKRLDWKSHLLMTMDQAQERPAVALPPMPLPFEKVTISGRWLSSVAHYGVEVRQTPIGPRMGSQLIAALSRPDAPTVLVSLGWIMDGVSIALPPGEIHVTGYVRPTEHRGWLSAKDDVRSARFYALDPDEIGKALALEVEPFTVVALQAAGGKEEPSGYGPQPATGFPRPMNNHLTYAATWFGLAATLLIVFGTWMRTQLSA